MNIAQATISEIRSCRFPEVIVAARISRAARHCEARAAHRGNLDRMPSQREIASLRSQ